jgi:hypothetical protein
MILRRGRTQCQGRTGDLRYEPHMGLISPTSLRRSPIVKLEKLDEAVEILLEDYEPGPRLSR